MTEPALQGYERSLVRVLDGCGRRIEHLLHASGRLEVSKLLTVGALRGQADALLVLISRVGPADAYEVEFHLRKPVNSVVQYAKQLGVW